MARIESRPLICNPAPLGPSAERAPERCWKSGHWPTNPGAEVYLAGGRLNPSESLAVARHSADGFGWGDGGSGAEQLALAILLRATDRETAVAHYQAFKWDVIAKLPQEDFSLRLAKVSDWIASRVDL